MDSKKSFITHEDKKDNLINNIDIINNLLVVLEQCDFPKQLIEKWEPLIKLYNQAILKEEIEKEFNILSNAKYKINFLQPIDKLAYHLQTSTSLLIKSLAKNRNERFIQDSTLEKLERLLGLPSGELTSRKLTFTDIIEKKYHDFDAVYINGKFEPFCVLELDNELNKRFLRLNEHDCYRLVSEQIIYSNIDEILVRKFYSMDTSWREIIEFLLKKLDNFVIIEENEYNQKLENLLTENDDIVLTHMKEYRQALLNASIITLKQDLENQKKIIQKKSSLLVDNQNVNKKMQQNIEAQLSHITANNFEKQKNKVDLEKHLNRLKKDAMNNQQRIEKLEGQIKKFDSNIANIEKKALKNFNLKENLLYHFRSNKEDWKLFCNDYFKILNDKNRTIYKLELYLQNMPNSNDPLIKNIYSMINTTLATGYIETRRASLR